MHPTFKRHLERINDIPHTWSPGALVALRDDPTTDGLLGRVRDLGLDHTHAHQSQHTDACYTEAHLRYTVAWIVNGVVAYYDVHAADELVNPALTADAALAEPNTIPTWQMQLLLEATAPGNARARLRAELLRRALHPKADEAMPSDVGWIGTNRAL